MLLAALSCVGLLPGPLLPPPPRCSERAAVWMGRSKAENRVILIDGNNLMMQRKVTKGRERLAEKLAGTKGSNVVLVFDGKKSEPESTSGSDPQVVITSGGDEVGDGKISADEWILEQLNDEMTADSDVQVVTADRELRRACHRASVKTINPVKFWRRYLPRLKGLKNDYSNVPKDNE